MVLTAAVLSFPAAADVFDKLAACCGEAEGGLVVRMPIKDVPVFEMVVVSDCDSPNTALNPSLSYDRVDLDMSRRIVYVQTQDGKRGMKLEFQYGVYNRLKQFDRVTFDLNGCKIRKDVVSGAFEVTGLTPLNIVKRVEGTAEGVVIKEKLISELTNEDLYTLVMVRNLEFVFKEGAIVNIEERFGQYVPALHSGLRSKMLGYFDSSCCVLRDSEGKGIYMGVNTLCDWRKSAAPLGSGSVTGVLVLERNKRYGDKQLKYYLRPITGEGINISDKKKDAVWKTYVAWIPERMPGNNFDFEKAGYTSKAIDDRLLNNVGPISYFWSDAGERRIQKAGSFNSLAFEDGVCAGGSIKLYGTVAGWYEWDADGKVAGSKSIYLEFSTLKTKAKAMQLSFEIAGGDGNLLNTRGIPIRWAVSYSVNDSPFKALTEIDGTETFGLRPLPGDKVLDKRRNRMYFPMYENCLGMQQHSFALPEDVIGKEKVVIRIYPCEDRWYHLSTNPARDVEYPDATVNLVKSNNKTFSTVRMGAILIDYR